MKKERVVAIFMGILMLGSFFIVPSSMISSNISSNNISPSRPDKVGTTAANSPVDDLKINVNQNPSFESMNSEDWPDSYSGYMTGYRYADPAYTSVVCNGSYAAYVAAQSVPGAGLVQASIYQYFGLTPYPIISNSMTIEFNWNTLNNLDLDIASRVYLFVQTTNSVGNYHEIRYYLSNSVFYINNSTSVTAYLWNFTIGNWNHFSRNVTADFNANPLIGPADSTRRITYLTWYVEEPSGSRNKLEFLLDDVSLDNGTYSDYVLNGDFESGDGANWNHYDATPIYVSQSTDSTDGTYSLNMTSGVVSSDSTPAYGAVRRSYTYPIGYYVDQPGDIILKFDWKHNRILGSIYQYSTLRVTFENETGSYLCNFVIGYGGDELIGLSNSTTNYYFGVEGFNIRNTWHHAELDLYQYLSVFGNLTGTIDQFYMYVPNTGSQFSLLVDDFRVVASVTGDPGFEQDWYDDGTTPFAGWNIYGGYTVTQSRVTDAFAGNYACNITPYTNFDNSGGVVRPMSFEVSPDDFLNAWWRLDSITDADSSFANIRLELDGGYSLNYLLGRGGNFGSANSSLNRYFDVANFNTTGVWTNLSRNITADAEEGLGISGNPIINNVVIRVRSGFVAPEGSLITLIVDNIMITDGAPPVVESVDQTPLTPMYYDGVDIHATVFDLRPGIDLVNVNYTTNGGTTWNSLPTSGTYDASIPALPYGTLVQYYVFAVDGVGLETIDDNGGSYYSYTVGDDINPTVSIDSPSDTDQVFGDMTIEVTADDTGSDIEYVEFFLGETLLATDYAAPYSYYVYLEIYDLGMYSVNVTAYDNAGNTASDSINITIVDGISPDITPLDDVILDEGVLGEVIDWDPTDTRPASYEVYVDDILSNSGLWNSSSEHVIVSLDGLEAGIYNYTCIVYDDGGNMDSDTVMVEIIDSFAPSISSPTDIEFTEGTTGQSIVWTGTDLHPDQYTIYQDGSPIKSGAWNSSDDTITVSLDGLAPGEYNFTCSIADESGNWNSDTAIVVVNAFTPTTTTSTETTTSSDGSSETPLLLYVGVGVAALLIVLIICAKMRKK